MRYLLSGAGSAEEVAARLAGLPLAENIRVEDHQDAVVLELGATPLGELTAFFAGVDGAQLLGEEALIADVALLQDPERALSDEELRVARAALLGLSKLWIGDLTLLELLRSLAGHPRSEVRAGVIAAASHAGYRLFLLELLAGETDLLLKRILLSATSLLEPQP